MLLQMLCQTDDIERLTILLNALLTDKEQNEIANRIQIFALLQQGLPQREIAEV